MSGWLTVQEFWSSLIGSHFVFNTHIDKIIYIKITYI